MGGFGWGMMGGWQGWGRGRIGGFGMRWPWFCLFAGILVLVGAIMLSVRPEQRRSWGLLILGISALYMIVGMMGLLAGLLGVIGGVLALIARD